MIRRSLLTGIFVLFATTSMAAPPVVNPADAVAFMNRLWDRAVEVLNNKSDPAVRQARFRELFHDDFDSPGIARFVLGRPIANSGIASGVYFGRAVVRGSGGTRSLAARVVVLR